MNRIVFAGFLIVINLYMSTNAAYAYLDPGNGSMLLQVLLGGVAGLAVGLKYYWQQIIGVFRSGKSSAMEKEES